MENSTNSTSSCCSSPWWVAGIIALLVIMVWRAFSTKEPELGYEDKRGQERREIAEAARKADNDRLNGFAAVDAAKGTYRVPLATAQQLTLPELSQKKAAPSQVKVDPWLPMPPPADPNATEPPPPALPSAPQGADTVRFDFAQPVPAAPVANPAGVPAPAPAVAPPAPVNAQPGTNPSAPANPPATPNPPAAPDRPPLIQ